MIYGVAYHVIPRFAGHPLPSRRLPGVHWWMANAGLLLMVCGFSRATAGTIVLSVGGTLSAAAAYLFVLLIWRTLDGPVAVAPSRVVPLRRVQVT
jgi:hypothetical protein